MNHLYVEIFIDSPALAHIVIPVLNELGYATERQDFCDEIDDWRRRNFFSSSRPTAI